MSNAYAIFEYAVFCDCVASVHLLEQEVQRLQSSSSELQTRLASLTHAQEKLQKLVEESKGLEEDLALEKANYMRMAAEADRQEANAAELQRKLLQLENEKAMLLKMAQPEQARPLGICFPCH